MLSCEDAWIRFKFFQRDCPHHGFNKVQLLSTFFRGIALRYQMALDTFSKGNFNTRNPVEAVRLIENLANSSNTKNTLERKKSVASLGKEQMDEVRAKLDVVHELLRKQVCSAEGEEAVDMEEEEDVNYIGGTGFQKSRNHGGNRNFYGNGQRSNQSSQFQKLSATTGEAMETQSTRIHHQRLKKARLKQWLTEFWKDSNNSLWILMGR
ncbi:hypothetical protein YC2023_108779 [Brassica napus]